jgi:hypothetical protein
MKHTAKLFAIAATAAIFVPFSANAALAHEGGVGDGTSVTVRLDTTLPAGIQPNLGNGEAELHVEPGMTVVVYGVEGEEMLKIDESGAAYQNMNSATWLASMEMSSEMKDAESAGMNMGAAVGGAIAMASAAGNEPDWKFLASGGALRWHDHRIHWMSGDFPKDVAVGDELMKFELPVAIDGEALTLTGALLYAGGKKASHDETNGHDGHMDGAMTAATSDSGTGGLPTVAVLVGVLLLLVGTGALLFSKSRKTS